MTSRRGDCESVIVYADQRIIDSHDHVIPHTSVAGASELVIWEWPSSDTFGDLLDAIDQAALGATTAIVRDGVTVAMITPWESA